ncbi:TPA: hypothetical protein ACGOW9_001856 [Streptococcus suis]
MGQTVGQIGLDLVVNDRQFKKQMGGIQSLASKAAKGLAAAFAVKELVDFGTKAIELGSDLAEVQNVVDVAFPKMSKRVDEFAQNAMYASGLSETMAKKYVGTFGAMAKAFGFSENEAYNMSTALTSLAGDVASFYNLSQDEAYTKLKSVFTGETESLKDLGVVMTQSALDAYAMANGFGKTTQAMSESEKVALRFAFVTNQLSLASGDFARTSDSWANQVRIMKLQFESFMASVGQGLINIFTPVIKVINFLLSKLLTVGNAFRALTELFTGKKSLAGSGIQETADAVGDLGENMGGAAGGADNFGDAAKGAGKAADGAGKAAKKAAKEMKSLMGFDQINKLSEQSDSGDSGGGSGGGGGGGGGAPKGAEVDMGKIAEGTNKAEGLLDGLFKRLMQLADLFKQGFDAAFRADGLERFRKGLEKIGRLLSEIFTDPKVVNSFSTMLDKWAYALGQFTGSIATIALGIGIFIVESIANGLERQKQRIINALSSLFDNLGDITQSAGNIAQIVSNTFYDVITSSGAIRIGSALVSALLSAGSSILEVGSSLARDLFKGFELIITENMPALGDVISTSLENIAPVFETLEQAVNDIGDAFSRVYDGHIRPFIESLSEGISSIVGAFIESFDNNVNPVIERFGKGFKNVYDGHIKPAMDSTEEAVGKVFDAFKALWEEVLVPFGAFLSETLGINLGTITDMLGGALIEAIKLLSDTWKGLMEGLEGFASWCENNTGTVQGLATVIGTLALAWKGIEFASVLEQAGGIPAVFENVKTAFNGVKTAIEGATIAKAKDIAESIALNLMYAKDFVVNTAALIAQKGQEAIAWGISTAAKVADIAVTTALTAATWLFNAAMAVLTSPITLVVAAIAALIGIGYLLIKNWDTVSAFAKDVWQGICDFISNVCQAIGEFFIGLWDGIKESCASVGEWVGQKFQEAWDGIVSIFGGLGAWFGERWAEISATFSNVAQAFGKWFQDAWDGIVRIFGAIGSWYVARYTDIINAFLNLPSWFAKLFQSAWDGLTHIFKGIGSWFGNRYSDIKNILSSVGTWFKSKFDEAYKNVQQVFKDIGSWFGERYNDVKNILASVHSWFRDKFNSAYQAVVNVFTPISNWFGEQYGKIKNVLSSVGTWFKSKFNEAYQGVQNAFKGIVDFFGGIWDKIKSTFTHVGTMVGNAIGGAVRSVINGVLGTVENTINGGIRLLNGAISAINKIPGVNLGSFSYVNLPRLAQGGFVKANTPQIAMIGDNKHYGEIVAPENKMLEMARKAAELTKEGGGSAEVIALLAQLLQAVRALDLTIDGDRITKKIVSKINEIAMKTGESPLIM